MQRKEGMPNIQARRCSSPPRTIYLSYNVAGSNHAMYCKHHAQDGIVSIYGRRCLFDSCTKWSGFNVEGSKKAVYCKQHADASMVNARTTTVRVLLKRPAGRKTELKFRLQ